MSGLMHLSQGPVLKIGVFLPGLKIEKILFAGGILTNQLFPRDGCGLSPPVDFTRD
jgi:hypothetical protein